MNLRGSDKLIQHTPGETKRRESESNPYRRNKITLYKAPKTCGSPYYSNMF